MNAVEICTRVLKEKHDATLKYGPFASAHEGYGVLAEEVAELLEAIRSNDRESVQIEACQVSAVAWRLALSLNQTDTQRRSGME